MDRTCDLVINATLAVPDAEISLFAPVRIPRVRDLPVLDAVLCAPANNLNCVAACHVSLHVMVDTTSIVLEVAVHSECCFDWSTRHDHLLDLIWTTCRLNFTFERVLVTLEVVVRRCGVGVARFWTAWRSLTFTTRLAFRWVWVRSLRSVVVAMR
jgi:hypothetical protein